MSPEHFTFEGKTCFYAVFIPHGKLQSKLDICDRLEPVVPS